MVRAFMWTCVVLAVTLLSPAAIPAAMAISASKPPEGSTPFIQWIVTVVLAGICGVIMFKNAKRTPND